MKSFRNFLSRNRILGSENEINGIVRRFDIDKNGKIYLWELKNIFSSFLKYQSTNKNSHVTSNLSTNANLYLNTSERKNQENPKFDIGGDRYSNNRVSKTQAQEGIFGYNKSKTFRFFKLK